MFKPDNVSNLNGTKEAVMSVFNARYGFDNVSCILWSTTDNGQTIATKTAFADSFSGNQELNVDVTQSSNSTTDETLIEAPLAAARRNRLRTVLG